MIQQGEDCRQFGTRELPRRPVFQSHLDSLRFTGCRTVQIIDFQNVINVDVGHSFDAITRNLYKS